MNTNEFIEQLLNGELRNLSIGEAGINNLSAQNKQRLIGFMNQGLKALCSRFQLVKKQLIIRAKEHVSIYPLRKEHSMTQGTSHLKFIDDTKTDPFKGNLIKILEVRNEIGLEFPINDIDKNSSVFTITYDTLQLTHPVENQGYFVIYQALHDTIGDSEDDAKEFKLPPLLEEALLAFVASKEYRSMNGEANKLTANEHTAVFEEKCLEAMGLDMSAESSVPTNNKPYQKGFI